MAKQKHVSYNSKKKSNNTTDTIENKSITENESKEKVKTKNRFLPKKRFLLFALIIASPIMLVGLLELGLRFFNYGPDLSLFVEKDFAGTNYYVMNPWVKARYFPNAKINLEASTDYFQVPKPEGTFRIFCLGGSTTAGFPYWRNASFASFLKDRLQKTFPEKNIEVINLGMTSINSFAVLDMVRELPSYQPDLIIVYDGHDEFYGGLGVVSNFAVSDSRWATQLYLRLIHSRVFLLTREIVKGVKSLFGNSAEQQNNIVSLETMSKDKNISLESPLYEKTKNVFKENLEEIRSICGDKKIPIIFSTQVSNVRDMPPIISLESKKLTGEQKKIIAEHGQAGVKAWSEKRWNDALKEFKEVVKIDNQHAGAYFAIARCLTLLGRTDEARDEYLKAKDCDQLRFRAGSDFNSIIRNIEDKTASVADMEKLFMAQSSDSMIGNEIILEHIHPNSYGNFLMAKEYASAIRKRCLIVSKEEWIKRDTVKDETLWNARPVTEIDERIAARKTEILISGKPFQTKPHPISNISTDDSLGQIAEHVVDGTWGWLDAHHAASAYYLRRNDVENVEKEFRTVINLNPLDVEQYHNLANFYLNCGKINEAYNILISSLEVEPTLKAYITLGNIALDKDKIDDAIKYFELTKNFQQSKAEEVNNKYQLAVAYVRYKKYDIAESELLKVLDIDPQNMKATSLLLQIKQIKKNRK